MLWTPRVINMTGGPLVDSRGRVVGINTAVIYRAQGISLAIPSATAKWVIGELMTRGKVHRAYLGIAARTRPIHRVFRQRWRIDTRTVAEVMSVDAGGPGEQAGIHLRDLIVAVNDRPVSSVDEIHRELAGRPAQGPIRLTLIRAGERVELRVLARQP